MNNGMEPRLKPMVSEEQAPTAPNNKNISLEQRAQTVHVKLLYLKNEI
jgi:hypothetical protein